MSDQVAEAEEVATHCRVTTQIERRDVAAAEPLEYEASSAAIVEEDALDPRPINGAQLSRQSRTSVGMHVKRPETIWLRTDALSKLAFSAPEGRLRAWTIAAMTKGALTPSGEPPGS